MSSQPTRVLCVKVDVAGRPRRLYRGMGGLRSMYSIVVIMNVMYILGAVSPTHGTAVLKPEFRTLEHTAKSRMPATMEAPTELTTLHVARTTVPTAHTLESGIADHRVAMMESKQRQDDAGINVHDVGGGLAVGGLIDSDVDVPDMIKEEWTPREQTDNRDGGPPLKFTPAAKYPDPPPVPPAQPDDNGYHKFMEFEKKRYEERKKKQKEWEKEEEDGWKKRKMKSEIEDQVWTAKRMAEQMMRKAVFMAKNYPIPFTMPGETPWPFESTGKTSIVKPPPCRGGGGNLGSDAPFVKVNPVGKPKPWPKPNAGYDKVPEPTLVSDNPNNDKQYGVS
eukprot:GFYU01007830.1.p1 GENE.GFYU01007830.1~~GFYU01007830.1.p1  ORF type:complete len:335 (-),score=65.00 GFYU01007830.1:346-1350(-)